MLPPAGALFAIIARVAARHQRERRPQVHRDHVVELLGTREWCAGLSSSEPHAVRCAIDAPEPRDSRIDRRIDGLTHSWHRPPPTRHRVPPPVRRVRRIARRQHELCTAAGELACEHGPMPPVAPRMRWTGGVMWCEWHRGAPRFPPHTGLRRTPVYGREALQRPRVTGATGSAAGRAGGSAAPARTPPGSVTPGSRPSAAAAVAMSRRESATRSPAPATRARRDRRSRCSAHWPTHQCGSHADASRSTPPTRRARAA